VRSVGSFVVSERKATARVGGTSTTSPPSASSSSPESAAASAGLTLLRFLRLDDVDAHLGQLAVHVLDLVGRQLLGGQGVVQLVVGDVAALPCGLDHLLDGGVRQIEQRAVRLPLRRRLGLVPYLLRHGFNLLLRAPLPGSTPLAELMRERAAKAPARARPPVDTTSKEQQVA
jgi:hypothetical protein